MSSPTRRDFLKTTTLAGLAGVSSNWFGSACAAEKDKPRHSATPYDQASVDVRYILDTMIFFETAGGRRYTGLDNQYQKFVDLSHLLSTNRAVLVGHPPDAESHCGGRLLRNGQPFATDGDRQTTIYRFVFPVKPEFD